MNAGQSNSVVLIGAGKSCSRAQFSSLLNTYNCFLKDTTHLQLTVYENEGKVTFEGILGISWGVKKPIQLQIQDEKPICTNEWSVKPPDPMSPLGNKRGMTRWGEFDDLRIDELEEAESTKLEHPTQGYIAYESKTLRPSRAVPTIEESSYLTRTVSDASLVKMRVKSKKMVESQRNRNNRFSINGHFYNYKTSIFTPSYGATTNVHITSKMTTQEVITQLLQKFKIENSPNEFALYCIHQSGEKRRLSSSDLPLWERVLQGPSNRIMKMFLMDADEQEVSLDVAQYLNLEMPILRVILQKLEEQEHQEEQRIIAKYEMERNLLLQCLKKKMPVKTETTV
ncbi:ras association domain-containing protein 6-like [Pimephales promelas]|uniref:ras association domain-containing protein 6-like n=1 Tax=Pimephales promelas TaxID=90988 RepID=UPI0019559E52|nr:ras association domain-containing protein 6-like [Pimephales promelas]KAG1971020.1 ras association domain-containing protein [Pimephales promelas]KAG1971022.1 ras association domain-containing protein [Pimephales promelas]